MVGFQNLLEPKNTGSGISDFIWLAPVSWFAPDGIKKPEPPFTNVGDSVIIKDDHEFLEGKGFVKMLLAPRKNKLSASTIGDVGLNKLDIALEVFIPGSYAAVHEQARKLLNMPLIVLCSDCDCPVEYVYNLGCDCASCWMMVDFSTGYTHEGNKGFSGTIRTAARSIFFYEGLITELPGEEGVIIDSDGSAIVDADGGKILFQ